MSLFNACRARDIRASAHTERGDKSRASACSCLRDFAVCGTKHWLSAAVYWPSRILSPGHPCPLPIRTASWLRCLQRERERIFPHLTLVTLPLGAVLYESGDTQRYIYFPVDAIVSLLYVLKDGASAEIAVVGNDGAIGIALFMGGTTTTNRAIIQSAGSAYRLTGKRIEEEFARHGEMLHVLLRYTQALITQMAQTAVCNRHHSVDQQLCRWLLLSLDRLGTNQLVMTQELIANMLGVRVEKA